MLRRPTEVYIDQQRCTGCGVCEQIVPGILDSADAAVASLSGSMVGTLPVSDPILDAMAACPTAAIRWTESTQ